jgi:SPP1 gp7 family putative phage head morphogenesis protein
MVTATTNFYQAALHLQRVVLNDQKFREATTGSRKFYREQKTLTLREFSQYEYLFSENYRRLQESGSLVTYPDLGHVEATQIYVEGVLSGQSYQETHLQVSRVFDRMIRESKSDPTGGNRLISKYEKELIQVYNDFGTGCLDIIRDNFGNPAETSSLIDKFQVKLMKAVRRMLKKQVPRFWQQGVIWAEINLQQAKKREEYKKPDIYIDPNQAAIDALIERNLGYIKGLTEEVKKEMLAELTEGMLRGEGIDQLVKRLAPYVDAGTGKGQSRAERIARTEVMYALNAGTINRYKRDGIDQVQWLAGPDDRACPVCLGYHLQTFSIDQAPENPAHPNCRCCFGPHFSDFDDKAQKDRERFEQDVNSGKAPYGSTQWSPADLKKWKDAEDRFLNGKNKPKGSVTFEDWVKTQPPEELPVVLNPGRVQPGEQIPKRKP